MFVHEMINGADPAHIALDGDVEITYGQLAETIRRFRNLLYREGVRKGDRVGLYCANRPGFIYTYMAVISWEPSSSRSTIPLSTAKSISS